MKTSSDLIRSQACLALAVFLSCPTAAVAADAPRKTFTVVEDASYKPPAPPAPKVISKKWHVAANAPLRQVLEGWAQTEGWVVYWPKTDPTTELVSVLDVNFEARNFQEAATRFLDGLPADLNLSVVFNQANSPKLLYINQTTNKEVQ